MPLPKPNKGEKQQDFISRCISFETKASPDRDPKQIQAMCYTQWRNAKGGKLSEEDFNTVEKFAFFGDNAQYDSIYTKKKGIRLWKKQLLKFGTWKHPDNKDVEFQITPDVVRQIISNFHAGTPEEAPVVLTHTDNPLMKVGRVKSLAAESDGLYGILSVADDGVNDKIELHSDAAPGVSCWLDLKYKDKQTGEELGAVIKHVALVNHPYIEGMAGFKAVLSEFKEDADYLPLVWLSEEKFKSEDVRMTKEELVEKLKTEHSVDVATLLSDSEELKTLHDRIDKGELVAKEDVTAVLSDEMVKDIKEKLKLTGDEKLDIPGAIKMLLEKVASLINLEGRLAVTEEKLSDAEASQELSVLLTEGRMLPAEKDAFVSLRKKDKETYDKFLKIRKEGKPLITLGETGKTTDEDVDLKEKVRQEALDRNLDAAKKEGRVK